MKDQNIQMKKTWWCFTWWEKPFIEKKPKHSHENKKLKIIIILNKMKNVVLYLGRGLLLEASSNFSSFYPWATTFKLEKAKE